MRKLKRLPQFKPMGFLLEPWGRCSCCRGRFNGLRVRIATQDGFETFICIGCASLYYAMQQQQSIQGGLIS